MQIPGPESCRYPDPSHAHTLTRVMHIHMYSFRISSTGNSFILTARQLVHPHCAATRSSSLRGNSFILTARQLVHPHCATTAHSSFHFRTRGLGIVNDITRHKELDDYKQLQIEEALEAKRQKEKSCPSLYSY
ncbi:hypothetical protein E6O75_ATG04280 [Venturia nashicola]|uniref:Uncharacterized protein n=1 Tax=Venturia nashicola TaxID=86259 RepID=A0A4Z1P992_9PEZI|nr:hypothetical protein E6O75_ATG04280 [Venturia nashicola]